MMTSTDLEWDARLTRLQGWRGPDAEAADNAKWAQRLAATGICVPSVIFVLIRGVEKGTAATLGQAHRTR